MSNHQEIQNHIIQLNKRSNNQLTKTTIFALFAGDQYLTLMPLNHQEHSIDEQMEVLSKIKNERTLVLIIPVCVTTKTSESMGNRVPSTDNFIRSRFLRKSPLWQEAACQIYDLCVIGFKVFRNEKISPGCHCFHTEFIKRVVWILWCESLPSIILFLMMSLII